MKKSMIFTILSLLATVSFAQHAEIYARNGNKTGEGMSLDGQHLNSSSLANVVQDNKLIQITNADLEQVIEFKPAVVNLVKARFATLIFRVTGLQNCDRTLLHGCPLRTIRLHVFSRQ